MNYYVYTIKGLNGSYDTLQEARAMYRWYLKQDGIEARILRGLQGPHTIIRVNVGTETRREFSCW